MTSRILVGDVRERLRDLPEGSIHCCVTSPPYYGLRDYGVAGQIGLESTLAEYITNMVDVFREVRRVLREDGTVFLNIGDSYAASGGTGVQGATGQRAGRTFTADGTLKRSQVGIKPKDLMLVPERLALALQDDGWWVRSRIIWAKKACMPESVTDRPTNAHEHIWLLTKAPRYFYDVEAVREGRDPVQGSTYSQPDKAARAGITTNGTGATTLRNRNSEQRNQRNVWHLGPEPFPDAHFATFVTEIPRRAIKAGTSEHGCCEACGAPWVRLTERERFDRPDVKLYGGTLGHNPTGTVPGSNTRGMPDPKPITTGWAPSCQCNAGVIPCTVLDPFGGSGTTGMVADQLGRDCVLVELNPEYAAMAARRIRGDAPLFAQVDVA